MSNSFDESDLAAPASRREFLLNGLLGGAWIAVVIGIVNAVARFVFPVKRTGGDSLTVEVAEAAELRSGDGVNFTFGEGQAVLINVEGDYRAFSRVCPHAACLVDWDKSNLTFRCPCHGARFDINGAVVSGPSPKPLPVLKTQVVGGKVVVEG
jgi:Rieske Fe-S protein